MDELLSKISECVELGKINQATPFPPPYNERSTGSR